MVGAGKIVVDMIINMVILEDVKKYIYNIVDYGNNILITLLFIINGVKMKNTKKKLKKGMGGVGYHV